jgi:tight adherence protein B
MDIVFYLSIIGCVGFVVYFLISNRPPPQVDLEEKLRKFTSNTEATIKEIELGQEKKTLLSRFDFQSLFAKLTGKAYLDALEKSLTQSDIPLKPGEFLFIRFLLVIMLASGTFILTKNIYAALAAFGIGCFLHIPVLAFKRSARVTKFVLQLAEFLVLITNSLKAGQTFLQGVDIASRESPNPIGMEFRLLLKETNLGVPVEAAFQHMLLRVPSEDLKIVMSAFSIQRNVGGNLADIMYQVAEMIRERIKIQGQIKVLTTQGKLSGAIVGLLPFGLGFIISLLNYNYMARLWSVREDQHTFFSRYLGPILLGVGIGLQLLGCFVIYKICDIEV